MANQSETLRQLGSPDKNASFSWSAFVVPVILLYVLLCSLLRYQRREAMHKKFYYPDRASMSKMTNVDAQAIYSYLGEFEFPKIFLVSLQFALFKTYGIPTISSLLVATKEFSTPENASKRYADTGVLIGEFTSHHPTSERVIKALARMNYVHSHYQKSGKISNADLLYTLSVFITEPISWVTRYEWRPLTDMEICAISTFWKSIGDNMGISYEELTHYESGWNSGLDFYADIKAWAEEYENRYMVPAQPNKQTADELVPLLLFYVPKFCKPAAANIVGVLMGDLLRKAMIYPTPPPNSFALAKTLFSTRKFFLRYLSLPRPSFMRVRQVGEADKKTGRYHWTTYQAHPYYNKPGFWNRWGPEALFVRFMGGDVPGSKGGVYIPEGYIFEEVGPRGMKGKGMDFTEAMEEKLRIERPVGCPFLVGR